MKKKILAIAIAAIMVLVAITGASLAYLQDTDYDKNVMTVGDVKIEQFEQERNGSALVDFTDSKKLYPATSDPAYTDSITVNGVTYPAYGSEFNPIDKIVTVKNTGSEQAYVRTLIAFEQNDLNGDLDFSDGISNLIHIAYNQTDWETKFYDGTVLDNFAANGKYYTLVSFTYKKVLESGNTTEPNLLQFFLDKTAENEDIAPFMTANYEVLAVSQAVQVAGWADQGTVAATAEFALNTAFGEINEINVIDWFTP